MYKELQKTAPIPCAVPDPSVTAQLVAIGEQFERWDFSRRRFNDPTGFYAYLISHKGQIGSQEIYHRIAEEGQKRLVAGKRLHQHEPGYMNRVWKTLQGEKYDPEIAQELYVILGGLIATFRAFCAKNPVAAENRAETARIVSSLPKMTFINDGKVITAHRFKYPENLPTAITADPTVDRSVQDGLELMKRIGRFGYPAFRLCRM